MFIKSGKHQKTSLTTGHFSAHIVVTTGIDNDLLAFAVVFANPDFVSIG